MVAANQWWICVTTSGSDGVIVATTIGSAESKAFTANKASGQYIPVGGPYTSLAKAKKALPTVVKYEQSGGKLGVVNQAEAVAAGIIGGATMGVHGGAENPSGQDVNPATNPLDWLSDIGEFFGALTEAAVWERATEVVAGFILIYVALKAITGYEGVTSTAKNAAGKAVKVAAVVPK